MARGHRIAVVGAAVALLAAAAAGGLAWSPWREDGPYDHALRDYGERRGEPNRYVDLGDGEAQLAFGSPDDHRLVVQWRDPDGDGWTAPKVVWADRQNTAVDSSISHRGGTVAIIETYTPDTGLDNDSLSVAVALVCRDLTCTTTQGPGVGGDEPEVTPDGDVAYVGSSADGVRLWTAEDGFALLPWSDGPDFGDHRTWVAGPALAPDGSLRLVASRPRHGTCTYVLFTSEPRSADLTEAARLRQPLSPPAEPGCQSDVSTASADWLHVDLYGRPARNFWFVRRDEAWTTTRQDPA